MKLVYSLFVPGAPKAQPRPCVTKTGHAFTPHSADEWKTAIKAAFIQEKYIHDHSPIEGPVSLSVTFSMPIPKSASKREARAMHGTPHTRKPDADNLLKAVMDALTDAGIWTDDCIVYKPVPVKLWNAERSGARIKVYLWEEGDEEEGVI
jgi:Holliday junction resolvase RusA-like endonuclease